MSTTVSALEHSARCGDCTLGSAPPFPFTMAYQPIVDVGKRRVYAFEALVRGPAGESAWTVLEQVTPLNRYAFDQSCRVKAIELAASLGLRERGARLSINFIPGAMYNPDNCVRATLAAARRCGLQNDEIILELTENEQITDTDKLGKIFDAYRANHLRVAIDDFGAGFSGLSLLSRFQPDAIKIDMALVRGIHENARKRIIVGGVVRIANELGVDVVAEGVETPDELRALTGLGVSLVQGYLLAKPCLEVLPEVSM